jgi:hypothetical protein
VLLGSGTEGEAVGAVPVHFLHVGKTGGSAVKRGLRRAGPVCSRYVESRYGTVLVHPHRVRLEHLPADAPFFFFLRDPVARFLSGFYSRLRKGAPRYYREWTPAERAAFDAFGTPQELAAALAGGPIQRRRAERALRSIRHLSPVVESIAPAEHLADVVDRVVYVGRQETLTSEWPVLLHELGLPPRLRLPQDPVVAHVGPDADDRSLEPRADEALRRFYAGDEELVAVCERLRAERGWGPPGGGSGA